MVAIIVLIITLLTVLTSHVHAATVTALSCSQTDITNAINTAITGDTVQLPNCVQVGWTGTLNITKRITLRGNGIGNTIIQRSAVASTENTPMFQVSGVNGFVMTNFTIDGTRDTHDSIYIDVALRLVDAVNFRIHGMNFTDLAIAIQINGDPLVQNGLIDHNTFTDLWWEAAGARGYGVAVYGNDTYPALSLGTAQNIFIEQNTFTRNRHAVASNRGARYVFRHNTIIDNREDAQAIDAHGRGSFPRGTRQVEIYENTVTNSVPRFAGVYIAGGDGVIWNNKFSSNLTREIVLDNANACASGTYPLPDQIRSMYIWNNTLNEGGPAGIDVDTGCDSFIVVNRDYFLTSRPGYTPYTFPHPLQGAVVPDTTTGLVYRLPFNEGSGNSTADVSGNQGPTTLNGSFTWESGAIGNYGLQFDGLTGYGQVSGLLGSPTSATIAAYVQYFGGPQGEVVSLGNKLFLRVATSGVRGFYWNGTTWPVLLDPEPLDAGWHHIAYTISPSTQKLYVDGVLKTEGVVAGFTWTGQGSNTTIGRNGNGATQFLNGRLDEVRVYNRVLSQVDINALIGEGPSPPVVTITMPTGTGTFATNSNTINLGGSATDNVSVTSVTVTCPQCNPALTDSAATLTGSTWSKSAIVLGTAPSTNVFTVKATDNEGTVSQTQLTVTYTVIPPTEGEDCTRWASNNGSGNGLTVDTPYTINQYWAQSSTAKVLCLKDDTYMGVNNMITPSTGIAGTSVSKIIVRAINDGKVLIDAQNTKTPVFLDITNQWFIISGINATNGLTNVYNIAGANNLLQRTIGWNGTSGQSNATVYSITGSNSAAEDCAGWGNNIRTVFSGSGLVNSPGWPYRRCWGEFNDHPTGTSLKGATFRIGVGQGVENVIGTVNRTGD